MAAISITANSVIPSVDAEYVTNSDDSPTLSHEAFTAGQTAYIYTDGTFGLSSSTGATVTNTSVGMFVNSGGAGQVCSIVKKDPNLIIGGTVILGKIYINGAVAGTIVPSADATTSWHVQYLGMAISGTVVNWAPASVCSSAIA